MNTKSLFLLSSSIVLTLSLTACSTATDEKEEIAVENTTMETEKETTNTPNTDAEVDSLEIDPETETYFDETTYPAITAATENFDSLWQEHWDATFLSITESTSLHELIEPMTTGAAALTNIITQFENIPVDNLPTAAQEGINGFKESFIASTNKRIEAFEFVKQNLEDGKKPEAFSDETQATVLDSNALIEEAYTFLDPILTTFGYEY